MFHSPLSALHSYRSCVEEDELRLPLCMLRPGLLSGDAVRIHGLKGRSDLNGQRGTLLKWVVASGRWAVVVHETGERVRVKEDNLKKTSR